MDFQKRGVRVVIIPSNGISTSLMAVVIGSGMEIVREMATDSHHKNNAKDHVLHLRDPRDVSYPKLPVLAMDLRFCGILMQRPKAAINLFTADVSGIPINTIPKNFVNKFVSTKNWHSTNVNSLLLVVCIEYCKYFAKSKFRLNV